MSEKHPKRPRDLNQWAKRMVDIATGEAEAIRRLSRKKILSSNGKARRDQTSPGNLS